DNLVCRTDGDMAGSDRSALLVTEGRSHVSRAKRVHLKLGAITVAKGFPARPVRIEKIARVGRAAEEFKRLGVAVQRTIRTGCKATVMIVHFAFLPAVGIPATRDWIDVIGVIGIHHESQTDLMLVADTFDLLRL